MQPQQFVMLDFEHNIDFCKVILGQIVNHFEFCCLMESQHQRRYDVQLQSFFAFSLILL